MKKEVFDLAIVGGKPLFDEALHVGKPNIGDRKKFIERANDIIEKNWLTNNGYYVKEFEKKISSYVGARNSIAISNGTTALEIAVKALGMSGEVIIPSFTFVATAHCLKWQGITPVFCDIEPDNHMIDPKKIVRLITGKTSGIIGVHLWGNPCNTSKLQKIAEDYNLKLLFDASHAFSVSNGIKMIGNFGDAEVFSFHATKFLNSFEGGAIVTNNDELAKTIRLIRNFGFSSMDTVECLGINGKMSEISAAMGITSLESMDVFIKNNLKNYRTYKSMLKNICGCKLIEYNEKLMNNYQYIVLEINQEKFGISRDMVLDILHAENIRARKYFYPGIHNMKPYRSLNRTSCLSHTNEVSKKVLCLPTGSSINEEDIFKICDLLAYLSLNSNEVVNLVENQVN